MREIKLSREERYWAYGIFNRELTRLNRIRVELIRDGLVSAMDEIDDRLKFVKSLTEPFLPQQTQDFKIINLSSIADSIFYQSAADEFSVESLSSIR